MSPRALLLTARSGSARRPSPPPSGTCSANGRSTSASRPWARRVLETAEDRHRDDADGLGWHLHRAGELAAIQDASAVEDLRLDVTALAVVEAASRVLGHWDV